VCWAQLEDELVFLAKIDLLQVLALGEIPEVQTATVLAAEQNLRNEAVLEGVGRTPFARPDRVVVEVPTGIVAEKLRSAVDFPAAERLEALVIYQKDPARRLPFGIAETAQACSRRRRRRWRKWTSDKGKDGVS
jgi:hypothetical protein